MQRERKKDWGRNPNLAIKNIYNTFMNLRRLRQILMTLVRHGFGHVVAQSGLDTLMGASARVKSAALAAGEDVHRLSAAERLAKGLEELGATFIKFGQVLATRPDILPANYIEAFTRLQDRVEPLPYDAIRAVLERSLGRPVAEVFANFDEHPLASGSIGQVHYATLHSGEAVVVKVKRPGTDALVSEDLSLLRYLAGIAQKHIPELRMTNPVVIIDEFARCMEREIDFVSEGAFTEKFATQFRSDDRIRVPKVFWDYVTRDTLVIGRMEGRSLSAPESLEGTDRHKLARTLSDCFLQQYFTNGFFHADPHPGNLFALPGSRLGIIDFGQTGQISNEMRRQFVVMLLALARGDADVIVDICAAIGVTTEESNLREFRCEFSAFLMRFYGLPMDRLDMGSAINEGIAIARRNGLILPRDFVLLTKSFVTVQGVLRKIDPAFRFEEALRPFLKDVLKESFDLKDAGWSAGFYVYRLLSLLKRAPEDARDILSKLRAGKTRIIFHHEGLEEVSGQLERASNRITLGLLISAILLGSSIVLVSGGDLVRTIDVPFLKGVPLSALIAGVGYLFAMGLGFWLAWGILRGKRL